MCFDAVSCRCSAKKVLLEISQNSQENNCTRVTFLIKLHASSLQLYLKKTVAQVFSYEFCKIIKNNFSCRTPPVAASEFVFQVFGILLLTVIVKLVLLWRYDRKYFFLWKPQTHAFSQPLIADKNSSQLSAAAQNLDPAINRKLYACLFPRAILNTTR